MKTQLYYQTQRNPRAQRLARGVKYTAPGLTIPGKARDLKQLVERMMNGLAPDERNAPYLDVEDIELVNSMFRPGFDLTDLDELKYRSEELTRIVEDAEKRKRAAAQEAAKAAKVEDAKVVE